MNLCSISGKAPASLQARTRHRSCLYAPTHGRVGYSAVFNRTLYTAVGRLPAAVTEQGGASTYDVELQRLLLEGPPPDFDFRAEVTACSRKWVDEHAPQLRDLVEDGTLVVVPRRPDYCERRTDGYTEPRVVLLVGTAHVSRRSQIDVGRVIQAVTPDSVVVELCKSRSAALMAASAGPSPGVPDPRVDSRPASGAAAATSGSVSGSGSDSESEAGPWPERLGAAGGGSASTSSDSSRSSSDSRSASSSSTGGGPAGDRPAYINPMNLAGGGSGDALGGGGGGPLGAGFLGAVARSVSLGGQSALLLRVLLAGLASRTAGSLGVAGGGEFAAAQSAADAAGSQVVLGDRPVEITLSRAWAALPLPRRLRLCGELLRGALGAPREALSEELVERLKSDDAVSAFFSQLSTSYPELVGPLVTERDLYLAWSLKRSKAVNGAGLVVGVVGRGHLRGVVYALLRDQGGAGLRFTDLVEGRNSRRRRREEAARGVGRLVIELALGTAAYLAWLAFTQAP